jgi:hypothetical protein
MGQQHAAEIPPMIKKTFEVLNMIKKQYISTKTVYTFMASLWALSARLA